MKITDTSARKKWWAGALALVLAVALTACGGSSSSSSGSPSASTGTNTGGTGGSAATTETKQEPQETKKSTYPEKPVTMVVPNAAGGSWDIAGRAIVKVLQEEGLIDFQMPVENVPGGSGAVYLAEAVTKRSNNDYEIFVNSPSILLNNLRNEAPSPFGYKDTTPLAQLFRDYGVIAVRADSEFNDLKSLFDKLRENPSAYSIGGGSAPGSLWHLNFAIPAHGYGGIDLTKLKYVSFNGNAESMAALLGGHIDILSSGASDVKEFLSAGQIKVLALIAPKRLGEPFQDVPTLAELGINADFSIWRGVFGMKNMSQEAKDYWNAKFKELSENEGWKKMMAEQGWEPDYLDADQFKAALDEQNDVIYSVLKVLGMAD